MSEIWLTDILNGKIFPDNYVVYHEDKNVEDGGVTKGDGGLLATDCLFHSSDANCFTYY